MSKRRQDPEIGRRKYPLVGADGMPRFFTFVAPVDLPKLETAGGEQQGEVYAAIAELLDLRAAVREALAYVDRTDDVSERQRVQLAERLRSALGQVGRGA